MALWIMNNDNHNLLANPEPLSVYITNQGNVSRMDIDELAASYCV